MEMKAKLTAGEYEHMAVNAYDARKWEQKQTRA